MKAKQEKKYLRICFIINSVGSVLLLFHFSNKITIEIEWIRLIVIQCMIFNFTSLLMVLKNKKEEK